MVENNDLQILSLIFCLIFHIKAKIVPFLLLMVATLAASSFKPDVRIINGESAEPGQFPFIVALLNNNSQYCAGSIINKNWIITAAHCADANFIDRPQILAGTNLLRDGGKTYNITRSFPHPNFSHISLKNDIGLMKIDGEFDFNNLVQPIDYGYAESNDTVTVTGWGEAEGSYSPDDLRYVELRALSLEECKERVQNYTEYLYVGPEQVCALANNKGVCYGDSGGPLISNGKLVGIVSYVFTTCGEGVPDVYTRPTAYTDWINQNIQE